MPGARGLDSAALTILGDVINRALAWAVETGELPNVLGASAETIVGARGSILVCFLLLRDGGRAEPVRARAVEIVTKQALSNTTCSGGARRS